MGLAENISGAFILLVGRILNRFTKDISVIDENLPVSLFDYLQVGFLFRQLLITVND